MIAQPLETSVVILAHPLEHALRVLPLADSMTIGRLGYGALQEPGPIQLFDDRCSSGRHARIVRTALGAAVQDMGGTNTTLVNCEKIRNEHLLRVGDQLQTGRSLFRFEHRLAGVPVARDAQSLLDAILRSPEDDGPRSVYADWLCERGHPRGEFINCQLADTPASRARADALLSEHELEWVAPLPVPVESWTFARGFVASVCVRDRAAGEVLRRHHPLARVEAIAWERVERSELHNAEIRQRVEPPVGSPGPT